MSSLVKWRNSILASLLTEFTGLRCALVLRARLFAASIPPTAGFQEKLHLAQEGYGDFCKAERIDDFVLTYFNEKPRYTVSWPPELLTVLNSDQYQSSALSLSNALIGQLGIRISLAAKKIKEMCRPIILLSHCIDFIDHDLAIGDVDNFELPCFGEVQFDDLTRVHCSHRSPALHQLDPIFQPSFSLLESPQPSFRDDRLSAISYFWYLSIKECLASELCALNIAEYDGLPLAFYCDMAKQCYDETRHAYHFLQTSLEWLINNPEISGAPRSAIAEHNLHIRGLAIPIQGNFFEMIHAADLAERLILMNAKTESVAVQKLRARLSSKLSQADPHFKFATEVDLQDEISHVRIGATWLSYLMPDSKNRSEKINDTMLIRGALMLNTFAASADTSVSDLANAILTKSLSLPPIL